MNKKTLSGVNETYYYEKLPNGLDVYLFPIEKVNSFYITFSTHFGSIYTKFKMNNKEYTVPNGIAHFLEHITFKIDEDKDASEIFSSLGSSCNAYTSFKVTCYEVTGTSKFEENLTSLLDYVQKPYYTDKIVEKEKGIICEEIKMYEDDPGSKLSYAIRESIYHNSNYRYKVSGECEDVNNTTLEDINTVYNAFYHPSNMFIIITGNFDYKQAIKLIKDNQASKTFSEPPKLIIETPQEPDSVVEKEKVVTAPVEIDKVSVSLKMPKSIFKDINLEDWETRVYTNILLGSNFGHSSILYEKLIDQKLITDDIYYKRDITEDHVVFTVLAETKNKDEVIKKLKHQLQNLSITEDDFNRKRKVLISEYIQSFDDIEEVSYDLQTDLIDYGQVICNYYDIYNNIKYE